MAINRFKDLPNRTTPINAQSLNEMKNVELLAVSDKAPETFSEGQQYYNKNDKVIYTASATAWKVDGEKPIEGIFYIVKGTKSNYYYDVENDNLISVGGGSDAVPTGAIMDYDGVDVPIGYEEASSNEVVLYDNPTGTNGNITLNKSAVNYSKLEVLYNNNDSGIRYSAIILNPNGFTHAITRVEVKTNGTYLLEKDYTINGTSMTAGEARLIRVDNNATTTDVYNNLKIFKVIGYK